MQDTCTRTSELPSRTRAALLRLSSPVELKKNPFTQRVARPHLKAGLFTASPKWPRMKRDQQQREGGSEATAWKKKKKKPSRVAGRIHRCSESPDAARHSTTVIIKTTGIIRRSFDHRLIQEKWRVPLIPTQVCSCRPDECAVGHSRLQRAARREKITVFFIQHSSLLQQLPLCFRLRSPP